MSGALSSSVDILAAFRPGLIDASLAGLDFVMIDHRDMVGRRALRYFFPGVDTARYDDLGQDSDPISVAGFYVGDDYVEQGQAFRQAFFTRGPQTLVHPWLGTVAVIISGKGSVRYTQDDLRMIRIEFQAWVYISPQLPQPDTLQNLLNALSGVRAQVLGYIQDVLTVQQEISGAVSSVTSFFGVFAGAWTTLSLVLGTDPSAAALGTAVASLGTADTILPGTSYPDGVAALLAAPSLALSNSAVPPAAAAVAPGSPPPTPPSCDPRIVATCLSDAGPAIGALPAATAALPGPALTTGAAAYIACDLATVISDVPFTSQQDAEYWLGIGLAQIDAASAAAAAASVANPVTGGLLWRALIEARSALSDDMTSAIGRLPAVQTLVLPAPTDLWVVAQYLSGDDPTQVVPMYLDLRSRNDVIDPGAVSGSLEYLQVNP